MPWRGISEAVDVYGRMRTRVRMASANLAEAGAAIVKVRAQINILNRFVQHTGNLFESMYSDPVATELGSNDFTARAFPRGGLPPGTPYGRIQELGGTIHAHNPTGLLWFDSVRDNGTVGVISVPEVTLEGRFYLRDALEESLPELQAMSVRAWGDGVSG